MDIFYSIIGFILAVGILVIIHEFGHFYVARLFQVRVTRFSIGFGPSRRIWYDKLGTEYVISAIPLGGYIELLDTSDDPNKVKSSDQHMAINNKSAWIKICILLAGPLFNILFAIVMYWLVFVIGIATVIPIVGVVSHGSVADLAKLKKGLLITKVSGNIVNDWEDVTTNLMKQLRYKNNFVPIEAYNRKTSIKSSHILNVSGWTINETKGDLLKNLGLEPFKLIDPKIWQVMPKYPAFEAGIRSGDTIVAINNVLMHNGAEVSEYIHNKAYKQLNVDVERNGEILSFTVVPVSKLSDNGEEGGLIGVQYRNKPYPKEFIKIHRYGIVDSFYRSIIKTYNYTTLTGYFLYSMAIGKLSLSNAAGPVAIGYYAGQSIKNGIEYFLNFLGMVSISLGVLNLLPIPWLDGGSIAHCAYELLSGKSAPQKAIIFARTLSLAFLTVLAVLVFINDIMRL